MAYSNGYTYRRRVSTAKQQLEPGGTFSCNFLLKGTYEFLKTTSNGGKVENANGYDIRFETITGDKISHDLVHYNGSTGEIVIWLDLSSHSLYPSSELYRSFFIFYGNSSQSTPEADNSLWGDYLAVWQGKQATTRASSQYQGIDIGIHSDSDLSITLNSYNGGSNDGEVELSVSTLKDLDGNSLTIGSMNYGVAMSEVGSGNSTDRFIMYSVQSVHTRFTSPAPHGNNADHFIGVHWNGTNWQYDNNTTLTNFTPVSTDLLIAYGRNGNPSIGYFYPIIGGSVEDKTGNGHSLFPLQGTISDGVGKISTGMDIDGNNTPYVTGNDPALEQALPVSVSMWVKLDSVSENCMLFVNQGDWAGATAYYYGFNVYVRSSDNKLSINYGNGGVSGPTNRVSLTSDIALTVGEWQHIVVTLRGLYDVDVFVNGKRAQNPTYSGASFTSITYDTFPTMVGSLIGRTDYDTQGIIEDVRIWSGGLDEYDATFGYFNQDNYELSFGFGDETTDTGYSSATTAASGTFSNPTNALVENGSYATDTLASPPLILVQLSYDGGTSYASGFQGTLLSDTNSYVFVGGPEYLWGRSWANSEISNANFRVRVSDYVSKTLHLEDFDLSVPDGHQIKGIEIKIKGYESGGTAYIDYVAAKLYTEPAENGYAIKKLIDISSSMVQNSSDLSNFELFVDFQADFLKLNRFGGNVYNSTYPDIRFQTTGGTLLDFEIERWEEVSGKLQAWVKIPTLEYDSITNIELLVGSYLTSSLEDPTNVWNSNVLSAYHLSKLEATPIAHYGKSSITVLGRILFSTPLANPIVVAYPTENNGGTPYIARVKDVSTLGFTIENINQDGGAHTNTEEIHWIAVESGSHTLANYGTKIEAGKVAVSHIHRTGTSTSGTTVNYNQSYTTPVVLHTIQDKTSDGSNIETFMASGAKVGSTSVELFQEALSTGAADPGQVNIGYIVIEAGETDFFHAQKTSDGNNDGVGETAHRFSYTFESEPAVIISGATLNGGDGYWALGAGTATNTYHDVYAQEDTIGDGETAHADETFSMLALAGNWGSLFDAYTIKDSKGNNNGYIYGLNNWPYRNEVIQYIRYDSKVGPALNFNKTVIDTDNTFSADYTGDSFTIAVWLKLTSIATENRILGDRTGGGITLWFQGDVAGDPFTLTFHGVVAQQSSASGVSADTWYHLVVTYDKSNIKFYLDGNLLSSHAQTASIPTSTVNTYIGSWNDNSDYNWDVTNSFNGEISELRFIDTALDADTIKTIYNNENASSTYIRLITTDTVSAKARIQHTESNTVTAKGNIKKGYEQTLTAKACIQRTESSTVNAKARIQRTESNTISAKANINAAISTVDATIQSKARVRRVEQNTVNAKASIKKTFTATTSSKARIGRTLSANLNAKGRIIKEVTQTISAKAAVLLQKVATVNSKASIKKEQSVSINAKALISTLYTKTVTAKANIIEWGDWSETWEVGVVTPVEATIQAKARIQKTQSQEVNAKARVEAEYVSTVMAKARISRTESVTLSAKARVLRAEIANTVQAKANIISTTSQTLTAKARIQTESVEQVDASANILNTSAQQVDAKSRIIRTEANSIQAKARIETTIVKTLTTKANILTTEDSSINGKARIERTEVATLSAKARIEKVESKTIEAKARIQINEIENTLSSKANILATSSQSLNAKARIETEGGQSINAKANIKDTKAVTVTAKARIRIEAANNITAKGNVRNQASSDIEATSNIKNTLISNVDSKANIKATSSVTVEAAANIKITTTRTLSAKARVLIEEIANTISGLANIKNTEEATLTSKARIAQIEGSDIDAKANVVNTNSATISSKSRIRRQEANNISAKALIEKTVVQTIQALARIIRTELATINSKARISREEAASITSKARIQTEEVPQTVESIANVRSEQEQTIDTKARVVRTGEGQQVDSKANILNTNSTSIESKARVSKEFSNSVNAKALIQKLGVIQTIQATANILKLKAATVLALARVSRQEAASISTKARVTTSSFDTVQAKARIGREHEEAIEAKARISRSEVNNVEAKARIKVLEIENTLEGKANIKNTQSNDVSAKARVKGEGVNNIDALANVRAQENVQILALARVRIISENTVSAKARIKRTEQDVISAKANILSEQSATVNSRARIEKTQEVSITATANIIKTKSQDLSAKAHIYSPKDVTIEARARIRVLHTETIEASARITRIGISATVQAKANIIRLVSQTIQAKALVSTLAVYEIIDPVAGLDINEVNWKRVEVRDIIDEGRVSVGNAATSRAVSIQTANNHHQTSINNVTRSVRTKHNSVAAKARII